MPSEPLSAEAAFIHAVIEDDLATAKDLLTGWLAGELSTFYDQLSQAQALLAAEREARGPYSTTPVRRR